MDHPTLIDNMILTYLAEAIAPGYEPRPEDEVDRERVASLRLFFWANLEVGETAVAQSQRTADMDLKMKLDRLVAVLLPEPQVPDEMTETARMRTLELREHHSDEEDCRILAEAELLAAGVLVTFDKKLKRRLARHARVPVRFPSEQWEHLAIPRGTAPIREPHPSNGLSRVRFWRWD